MANITLLQKRPVNGSVTILVTFALVAMTGMMGLAVDLGWSFFVKKSAQSAADAAAMAAIRKALPNVSGGFTCAGGSAYCATNAITCGTVISGGTGTYLNLFNGCKYAESNGFTSGGRNGRQSVTVQSNDRSTLPPTAPGVNDVRYWVTVTVTETIPQLFSAVLGNTQGQIQSRATAAVVATIVPGSFYALNRETECMGTSNCGIDMRLGGNGDVTAPGGVIMASRCAGNNNPAGCDGMAGQSNGNPRVTAPTIEIRLGGTADSNSVFQGWTNGGDGARYSDPTQGKTQPPVIPSSPIKTCGVLNGQISQNGNTPVNLGPYNYYAYSQNGNTRVPTGDPIVLSGNNVNFSTSGRCEGVLSDTGADQTSSFPSYMFYGGLRMSNGSNVTFGSGQYVMVGAAPNGQNASPAFQSGGGNSSMTTAAGGSNMFITTAPTSTAYPGLATQLAIPEIGNAAANLWQGYIDIKAGNSSSFDLTGYNKSQGPAALEDYNGVLFWQDRRNSSVKYNLDGSYNCAGPAFTTGCTKNGTELNQDRVQANGSSTKMVINATANLTALKGVMYQPRGGYLSMQGNGDYGGGLQIITGALEIGGGGNVTLTNPTNPLLSFVAALIE